MPNSILWIGLVVMWLFVLFPILADRHPRIRQTTDVALATRVLHRGGSKRKGRGPASGHDSDPDWRPAKPERTIRHGSDAEDPMDTHADEDEPTAEEREGDERAERKRDFVPSRRGRGGFDPEADAIARAARYAFRQRTVLGLLLIAIMTGALAVIVSSAVGWVCGVSVAILAMYLTYLRRQVRMEEEIRRRRMARLSRARLGVESQSDDELRLVPARLRRPGAVVVEVDDEDPVFEHLDHFDGATVGRTRPPAADARMRRAAGE